MGRGGQVGYPWWVPCVGRLWRNGLRICIAKQFFDKAFVAGKTNEILLAMDQVEAPVLRAGVGNEGQFACLVEGVV